MKFTPLAALLLSKFGPGMCYSPTPGGGGGAIPVYGLDRYVLLDGVWFLRVSIWGGGGLLGLIFAGYVPLAS